MSTETAIFMKPIRFSPYFLSIVVITITLLLPRVSIAQDSDGDGINDAEDNCIQIANADQRDSNNDGFGNICDADLDNDNAVSFSDLDLFRLAFGTDNADADFDGSGFVSYTDLDIFKQLFAKPLIPIDKIEPISKADAARFLTQTTFGSTLQSIDDLVSLGSYEGWLAEQFEQPMSSLFDTFEKLWLKTCPENGNNSFYNSFNDLIVRGVHHVDSNHETLRTQAWWDVVLTKPDQLRQRVALALSEILVVSSKSSLLGSSFGLTDYYDVLLKHSFGNYRELLEEVTLHPMMGRYLNVLMNEKADAERNIRPDENYARELLQLFTIGVHELNIDGSLKLSDGNPIPTYTQTNIEEFARVFTGWHFANFTQWSFSDLRYGHTTVPMKAWSEFHDSNSKNLLNGAVLPAGQTPLEDLQGALDNIFAHANVGPFISQQLIQRLVTSNPSNAYVQRVAQVFNNNGEGTRGDLKAVVKAIFLDQEARAGYLTVENFGKLREPLLRISHLRRAFDATQVVKDGACGRGEYHLYITAGDYGFNLLNFHGQQFLQSPTVFNFFMPDFSPAGALQTAEMVAPEFQIVNENTMVRLANSINQEIQLSDNESTNHITKLQITREAVLATNHQQLLEHLDLLLLNGHMSIQLRQTLMEHLENSAYTDNQQGLNNKAKDSIMLIVMSPEYLIQK